MKKFSTLFVVCAVTIFMSSCLTIWISYRSATADTKPVKYSQNKLDPRQIILRINQLQRQSTQRMNYVESQCREKKEDITKRYLDYGNYSSAIQEWVWMAFPSHNLFYCAIPKCGSTTWKSYLMEDTEIDWEGIDTHVAAKKFGAKKHIAKSKMDPIEWLSKVKYTNRLMIVRNPWGRIASAYEDKILRKKWELKKFCRHLTKFADTPNGNATFAKFVDCLLSRPAKSISDVHVHPQSDLCAVCHVNYTLIVKLEELAANELFLMRELNFKLSPVYKPPQQVKSSNVYAKYYKELDEKLINRLKEEYRTDIDLFGYPNSPFE